MTSTRYLEGPFAPVKEEVTAFDLAVTGRIPPELKGRYLRIGPNPIALEDPRAHHWFMGEGMVHGVRLRDGRAEWYRNRWVRSARVARILGEPRRGASVPEEMDSAPNTALVHHGGRTLAVTDAGARPYELDEELGTVGPCELGSTPDGFTTPAHPKLDPRTGELHAIAYVPGIPDRAKYIVADASGRVSRSMDIPVHGVSFMHDFSLTERYVVVYDAPLSFSMEALGRGQITPVVWDDRRPARVGIMPRAGGDVRWLEIEPCYISHTLNAHDEGSSVIVDLVRYSGWFDADAHVGPPPRLERWTIDLERGKVLERQLDDRPQEFPRINERFVSRPHRYGYTAIIGALLDVMTPAGRPPPDEALTHALIKHDLVRGTSETHRFGRDEVVGEAVFAPATASPSAAEDDGYVMAYADDPARGATDLVILSAQDFTRGPVARIHLPARVPIGLHGSWIPDA